MANNRIFYACQAVGIKPCFLEDGVTKSDQQISLVHGVQSVGVNTSFNLEQAYELGMIQTYENIEGLPDVEVTTEKVLDGYPLIYHLATAPDTPTDTNKTNITSRSKRRSSLSLGIYPDDLDAVTGMAPVEVAVTGMYLSNLSYTLPVEGNCTESVSFVANDKMWYASGNPNVDGFDGTALFNDGRSGPQVVESGYVVQDNGAGADFPYALDKRTYDEYCDDPNASGDVCDFLGGVQRRENVRIDLSIFPTAIFGTYDNRPGGTGLPVAGNAYDSGVAPYPSGSPTVHFQNISISTDTSREDILELGSKNPYYRAPNFPVEVTCEFEAIAISGDWVNALANGDPKYIQTRSEGNNTTEEYIIIKLNDGTVFDLGGKNRLTSVNYGGGDAGGGNASLTYSYSNFNDLRVLHPLDPQLSAYSAAESGMTDCNTNVIANC